MSASRRRPTSRFQPGMAAMKAWTGASPSPFAICGLPPERRAGLAATRLPAVVLPTLADFLDVLTGIGLTPWREIRLRLRAISIFLADRPRHLRRVRQCHPLFTAGMRGQADEDCDVGEHVERDQDARDQRPRKHAHRPGAGRLEDET